MKFYKYQGCGNDFVLLDQRNSEYNMTSKTVKNICDRRFGVGADGLMELYSSDKADFEMRYYNSDGNLSSFCGNGGRCIAQFSKDIGAVLGERARFIFNDAVYTADFLMNGLISLNMQNVLGINRLNNDLYFNTGSPHYLHFTNDIDGIDLIPFARKIRYSNDFPEGINVNLVEEIDNRTIKMRTYERGVEDETFSCGTGVTAAAIALHFKKSTNDTSINVNTKGGNFKVEFSEKDGQYFNINLIGPAFKVFEGTINLEV
jgi:diaminopimelate epimerase